MCVALSLPTSILSTDPLKNRWESLLHLPRQKNSNNDRTLTTTACHSQRTRRLSWRKLASARPKLNWGKVIRKSNCQSREEMEKRRKRCHTNSQSDGAGKEGKKEKTSVRTEPRHRCTRANPQKYKHGRQREKWRKRGEKLELPTWRFWDAGLVWILGRKSAEKDFFEDDKRECI